jgi:hypothetical protein
MYILFINNVSKNVCYLIYSWDSSDCQVGQSTIPLMTSFLSTRTDILLVDLNFFVLDDKLATEDCKALSFDYMR